MGLRRLEQLGGILGGLLSLAALGGSLYAPLGEQCTGTSAPDVQTSCHPASLVQEQGLASLSFVMVMFGELSLGIALFAVAHSLLQHPPLLILLWVCTVLLVGATLLALLSIGVCFMPADALALLTTIVGTLAGQQQQGHGQRLPTGA